MYDHVKYYSERCKKLLNKMNLYMCGECRSKFQAGFGVNICPFCGQKQEISVYSLKLELLQSDPID